MKKSAILGLMTILIMGAGLKVSAQGDEIGFPGSFPEFHGVGDLQYYDFAEDGTKNGIPTFKLQTFHLSVESYIRKDLSIFMDTEWEEGKDTKCERIEFKWRLYEALNLRFGKTTSPIGIEGELHYASIRKLTSRPFVSRQVIPGTWPEVGIVIHGQIPLSQIELKYDAILSNGLKGPERDDRQTQDNNSSKMIGLRIGAVPVKGLETGGYYSTGKYDDDGLYSFDFTGAYLILEHRALNVRSEYILNEFQHAKFDSVANTSSDIKRNGFYVQASYRLYNQGNLNYFEPIVRYDMIDPDEAITDNNDLSRFTLGINVSPYEHFLFKFEYQLTAEKEDPKLENNGFMSQAVIDF